MALGVEIAFNKYVFIMIFIGMVLHFIRQLYPQAVCSHQELSILFMKV